MNIAYVAQTDSSTLMLDAEGVCLSVQTREGHEARTDGATRCIGAQYVASMDHSLEGGLAATPRIGCPMLFAAAGANGRIYVVRTGPVVHFAEVSSGVHDRELLPRPARQGTMELSPADFESDDQTTPYRPGSSRSKGLPAVRPPSQPTTSTARPRSSVNTPRVGRPLYVPPAVPGQPASPAYVASAYRSTIPPPAPLGTRRFYDPDDALRDSVRPAPIPDTVRDTMPSLADDLLEDDSDGGDSLSSSSLPTQFRRRPMAPSSHAWLRGSPAAVNRRAIR